MAKTIHWGIIGCGDVTEVKSGPALQKADGSQVVAVMRRDGTKAADYARRHGVAAWYDDADALIADANVDAVYVATPPSSHADYACRVAAAGKPVYVEKPMARTYAECVRMIDACATAGVPLFVAYYRRCQPRFVKVKELIDGGAIGAVLTVNVTLLQPPSSDELAGAPTGWRVDPTTAGGGKFVDLASHTLDLLDHLLGPIAIANGAAVNRANLYTAEDTVAGHFRFAGGPVGAGLWSFAVSASRDVVEIVGRRGTIRFATFADVPVTLETSSGVETFTIPQPPHVQQPLIQTVVDALLGRGDCPSTGVSAARTSAVLDAMLADWRVTHPLIGQ